MYRQFWLGVVLVMVVVGSVQAQGLQTALNDLGYSIDVATDGIPGEVFFQHHQDEARIVFQESSQYLIEAVGWYSATEVGEWLVGGASTGFPAVATIPDLSGEFGFKFHPNFTGTGFIDGIWYSERSLNSDGIDHLWIFPTAIGGQVIPYSYVLAWEDLEGGGDRDFQDMVVRVEGVEIAGASPLPSSQLLNLSQWRAEDGGNDHWYAILAVSQLWSGARNLAGTIEQGGMPGHLATITSQGENDFLFNTVTAGVISPSILDEYFLGGYRVGADWAWVSGEPFTYLNWAPTEPSSPDEQAVAMWGRGTTNPNRVPGMWNDEDAEIYAFWSIIEWEGSSSPGQFASLSGTVSANSEGLEGVVVELSRVGGETFVSATTDHLGVYEFADLSDGPYNLDVQLPLGFVPVSEPVATVDIVGIDAQVDFELAETAGQSSFTWSYWWWKIAVDQISRGETPWWGSRSEIESALQNAYDHFYDRTDGYGIQIQEVTCIGDPSRAMTFDDLHSIFFPVEYDGSYAAKARRALLTVVLDLASSHMPQTRVVSVDGATASQALTYFADLYVAGGDGAAFDTYLFMKKVWADQLIPAGVVPLSTPNIMYKEGVEGSELTLQPEEFTLSQNYPNPFNPTTEIRFTMTRPGPAMLDIYNIAGQKVVCLIERYLEAGPHRVTWDARDVASGIYFYRLETTGYKQTRKMILLK